MLQEYSIGDDTRLNAGQAVLSLEMLLIGGVVFLTASNAQTLIVITELVDVSIQNTGVQLCTGVVHYGKGNNTRLHDVKVFIIHLCQLHKMLLSC